MPMPLPVHPVAHVPQQVVGTLMVGGVASTIATGTKHVKKGRKLGAKDLKPRAHRTCQVCKKTSCPGTNNRKKCPKFKES